eukprot:GDKI01014163.1.p1 GENE.GDKI01014163.1~~GDKI01014163.1.p1  ORF type:complete len:388 (-),score=99.74 GDKI01014163.1:184-1347(-)
MSPPAAAGHQSATRFVLLAFSALLLAINTEQVVLNPLARHFSIPVNANTATVITLKGYEDSNGALTYYIASPPTTGKLYQTSSNYQAFGSDPKQGALINAAGIVVSDPLHRVVYIPPSNTFPPTGLWSTFTYYVVDATSTQSQDGVVVLSNPDNKIASSTFLSDAESWTTSGNAALGNASPAPVHQPYGWGSLNRFIQSSDSLMLADISTGYDIQRWYFEAPSAFKSSASKASYGGTLVFTVRSTYGDFSALNAPLDWVTLECQACNYGRGLRLVKFTDSGLNWDGKEKTVSLTLATGNGWKRDPLNAATAFNSASTDATACEIAATLMGLTRIAILGDFTVAGEGVAIDNVAITAAPAASQPTMSVTCQRGCACSNDATVTKPECC